MHMPYNSEKTSNSDKPSLEEMVGKALDILEKDKKGFFLFVEGKAFHFFLLVVSVFFICQFRIGRRNLNFKWLDVIP